MKNNKQQQRNDTAWKENLNRWGAYAAAAGAAVALSTNADAEIFYSGAQNITVSISQAKAFKIGTAAVQIQIVNHSSSFGIIRSANIGTHLTDGLNFFGSANGLNKYAPGQAIGGAPLADGGILAGNSAPLSSPGNNPRGQFGGSGIVDGFVGFELKNGDLGWIQVKVTNDSDDLTTEIDVVDWAYSETGGPINAGQTSDAVSSSPEPGIAALGLLASGAAGLAAWRKRKVGQASACQKS
jgi:hypothetical protein